MQKTSERITHERVEERLIIIHFLSYKNITEKSDFTQRYPDCVIPAASVAIEETSVRNYEVARTHHLINRVDEKQAELLLKYDDQRNDGILIDKIKKAIRKKEKKGHYSELLKYEQRILIVRVNGICFDWRWLKQIAQRSNFSDLELRIFNAVYLVLAPITPTRNDIDNNKIPPLEPNFIQIIGSDES
jgi:hypothetical protein